MQSILQRIRIEEMHHNKQKPMRGCRESVAATFIVKIKKMLENLTKVVVKPNFLYYNKLAGILRRKNNDGN